MTSLPVATEHAVRGAVQRHWVEADRDEHLLVMGARPVWTGPSSLVVDDVEVAVRTAVSALAVRDVLGSTGPSRTVVLTDVPADDLGDDLLSKAVRQAVLAIDLWDSVRLAFGLRSDAPLDHLLVRDGEAFARALVATHPPGGWSRPASGALTRNHAYRTFIDGTIGLGSDRLDGAGVMTWTEEHQAVLRFRDLDDVVRGRVRDWVVDRVGAGVAPALDLAAAGDGQLAVPLGVVASMVHGPGGTERQRVNLEHRLGRRPEAAEIEGWISLAAGVVERRLAAGVEPARLVLDEVERLLPTIEAEPLAARSSWLQAGLDARIHALADAIASVSGRAGGQQVAQARAAVTAHVLSEADPRVEVLEMAMRLTGWLSAAAPLPSHVDAALRWHVAEGGWVDRARQLLAVGSDDPVVARSLASVHQRATERRAEIDRVAAQLVAGAVSADQPMGGVVPVEGAVRRLRDTVGEQPVLLLVLDGMSAAVMTELVESVRLLGWVEQSRDGGRGVLMAGLPTVTQVSRASLLAGRVITGDQRFEKRAFADVAGPSAALLHKGDLEGAAGDQLTREVREAVLDGSRPIVGVVLNAVDDSLSGGDPARTRWTVDAVRHLRPLLTQAGAAGRVVVLTSDHGHVVDHGPEGELRSATGGGLRWRPPSPDRPAQDDEVLLQGPRVQMGGTVVAAVGEPLRYAARTEGYHGGAALAEMAIPWVVLARPGVEVLAHSPVEIQPPDWWTATPDPQSELRAPSGSNATLFDEPTEENP